MSHVAIGCGFKNIVKIPLKDLSEPALMGIIENFVLREGTEYGASEHALTNKCEQVREQLAADLAEIWFDPTSQTIDIRLKV